MHQENNRESEGSGRKVWRIASQLAAGSSHNGIGGHCMRAVAACSHWLNWIIERICALLVAAMVVVVWVGTLSRYGISFDTSWAEELARYIMIWAALLAIPCGAYYREHIGLELLLQQLPGRVQRVLRVALDLCGLSFFLFLFIFSLGMVADGAHQYATIFGMTMALPFASVPTASGLTVLQIVATMLRDPQSNQLTV